MADLFDADGSAIMVHSAPDNFANIPERYGTPDQETLDGGDSGERVACGVIMQSSFPEATAEATADMAMPMATAEMSAMTAEAPMATAEPTAGS
jgi:hypothetical protein